MRMLFQTPQPGSRRWMATRATSATAKVRALFLRLGSEDVEVSSARTPASTSRMPSSSDVGGAAAAATSSSPEARRGERRDEPPGVGEGDTEARRDDETRATTPVRAEAALDVEPVDPGAGPRRADDTTRSRARGRPTAAPREPTPNILAIVERDANVRSATCPPHRTGRGGYIPTMMEHRLW